jgi:hypothetical protein
MTTPPTRSPEDVITRMIAALNECGYFPGTDTTGYLRERWTAILSTLSGQHTEATEQPHPLDRLLLNAYGRKCYDAGYAAGTGQHTEEQELETRVDGQLDSNVTLPQG